MFKKEKQYNTLKSTMLSFVWRIWTAHITAFALYFIALVLMSGIFAQNEALIYTVATCISTGFYVILVYLEGWRTGTRDLNLVIFEHIEENKYKGIIAAALSQLPGIIPAIFNILGEFSFMSKFYRWFYVNLTYIVNITEESTKLVYLLPALPAIVLVPLGYYLGYHEKRIIDRVMFKTNKSTN